MDEPTSIGVDIHGDCVNEALTWAREHTPSYMTNLGHWNDVQNTVIYTFYFSEERDITAFSLRWL